MCKSVLNVLRSSSISTINPILLNRASHLKMWFQSNVFMSLCAFCAVAVVAQQTTPTTEAPCVNSPEADNLARRWLSIFETDSKGSGIGAAIVNVTLSPNFTNYDEGATFGDPAPLYNSSNAVYASVSGSGYSGSLVTDVRYSTLFVFSSCNVIGLRWRSSSMSANTANV